MAADVKREPNPIATLVGQPLFWVLVVGVLLGWPLAGALRRHPALQSLPVMATLGDFTLRDQTGKNFGTAELRGKVWVANFIFTNCSTVCPRLSKKMSEVQQRSRNLGNAIRLVSFSVDPEHDTPDVLAEYAKRQHANPRVWSFLTGDLASIERAVIGGLKIGMGHEGEAPQTIFHDNHFVLIDARMRVRGYYLVEDAGEVDRLLRDVGLLMAREPAT